MVIIIYGKKKVSKKFQKVSKSFKKVSKSFKKFQKNNLRIKIL